MKFKVGDKVRLIKHTECTAGFEVGNIYVVTKINSKGFHQIEIEGKYHGYVSEENIEKIEFTKSDLQDGDIVTYRDGRRNTKIGYKFSDKNSYLLLDDFNEDLTTKSDMKQFDIVNVERPIKYETVFERKEEILDKVEKRYLSNFIRPFRDKVTSIRKLETSEKRKEYLFILLNCEENEEVITLPYFKANTMYKGMEIGKEYSLEELGL